MKTQTATDWTVTMAEKNIETIEPEVGETFEPFKGRKDDRKKAIFEYTLRFQGKAAHVLTGERGKEILEECAEDYNAKGYEPRFEKGKMICDLSQAARTKLALIQSPPLPLE